MILGGPPVALILLFLPVSAIARRCCGVEDAIVGVAAAPFRRRPSPPSATAGATAFLLHGGGGRPRCRRRGIESFAPSFGREFRPLLRADAISRAVVETSTGSAQFAETDSSELPHPSLYLERIGLSSPEIEATLSPDYIPTVDGLQRLLTAHLLAVPFENLDQHDHPRCGGARGGDVGGGVVRGVPRRSERYLPNLDVSASLDKIVRAGRGGFCFELNPSFCWLLNEVGYGARLALADVGCSQAIPAHVVVLIDGLGEPSAEGATTHLVDVGFGLPGVCNVVLPLVQNRPVEDGHGDSFRFAHDLEGCWGPGGGTGDGNINGDDPHAGRFDTVLYRTRIDTGTEEPMYRFRLDDDIPVPDLASSSECVRGLRHVLTDSPTFTGKRICVLSTEGGGHVTLGEDYIKWVERWATVKKVNLPTEGEWRGALEEHFGVTLIP